MAKRDAESIERCRAAVAKSIAEFNVCDTDIASR
jgi:hypothetical protein